MKELDDTSIEVQEFDEEANVENSQMTDFNLDGDSEFTIDPQPSSRYL